MRKYMTPALGMAAAASAEHDIEVVTPALGMALAAARGLPIRAVTKVGGAYQVTTQDSVEGDLRALTSEVNAAMDAAMDAAMIEISLMEDDEVLQQG